MLHCYLITFLTYVLNQILNIAMPSNTEVELMGRTKQQRSTTSEPNRAAPMLSVTIKYYFIPNSVTQLLRTAAQPQSLGTLWAA